MSPRLRWKEVTALSLLLPLLSAAPASARRNDGNLGGIGRGNRANGADIAKLLSAKGAQRAFKSALADQSRTVANVRSTAEIRRVRGNEFNFLRGDVISKRINDKFLNDPTGGAADCGCTAGGVRKSKVVPDRKSARFLQLDLTSEESSIALPEKLFRGQSWITVDVGGVTRTFAEGALVTPAEYVAVTQVLGGDVQTIVLNGNGVATGGEFSLNLLKRPRAFRSVTDLVVPENVVALSDVARGALRLTGDIVNHGQIVSLGRGDGKILANSVFNLDGATISTGRLADAGAASQAELLTSLSQLADNLSDGSKLLISASEKIVNNGTIFSDGRLTVSAPQIRNRGVMLSGDSLFVEARDIVNSGVIKAMGAVLGIASTFVDGLSITNNGGSFDAGSGNLIMSGAGPIRVLGGALNAQLVKLISPYSMVDVAVDSISGSVDVSAFASAVHVVSGDLRINNINVLDDPIFTNSTGNIVLPALISASSAPVTAVAAGDIIGHAGHGTFIDTSSGGGDGGQVILLAGVSNFTAGGTTTVTGSSGLNGSIYGITGIDASGSANGRAGDVSVGAFGGSINISGSILAEGKFAGKVNIFSPGDITVGDISARGGHTQQDVITIRTVNPNLGSGLSFDSTGKLVSGSVGMGSIVGAGSIVVGDMESGTRGNSGANAGNINVLAGGSVTTGFLRAMGGGAPGRGWALQGWDYGSNGGHGGSVSVVSQTGGVLVNGDINTSGGGGGGANHTAGGRGGDGGFVLITAIADVVINGPVLSPGGGGGGGVGISSTDTAGGGGSLGNGGGPNSGGIFYSPPPYDGPGLLDNGLNPRNPNRHRFPYAGMGGTNTAYDIGCCGSGYGGNAGDYGENGDEGTFLPRGYWNDTTPKAGGAPGLGGNITIEGRDIAVTKTIATHYDKKHIERSPYKNISMFTHSQRGGGIINLTTSTGTVTSTAYDANSDLESPAATIAAQLRTGNVTLAGQMRGDQVSLNGNALATTVGPGVISGGGTGSLTIAENGANKTISNGEMVTAAEWIALVQKATTGNQGLQLGAGGAADGGTFGIASSNIPTNGFTNLTVPADVTGVVNTSSLTSATTNVKGTLQFSVDTVFDTSNLTVSGQASAAGRSLTINTPELNLHGGSRISAGNLAIAGNSGLNVNLASGGWSAIVSSESGATIGLSGQTITFANTSGGSAALEFLGGPVDIFASTFSNGMNTNLSSDSKVTVSLSGGQFQNQGSISAKDVVGNGGEFVLQSSASDFAVNLGNLSVAPTADGGGHGGRLVLLAAAGNLILTSAGLDASASGNGNFHGGAIDIEARTFSIIGGVLNLLANGVGSGAGGQVSVAATGFGSDLFVDGGAGHLAISAHGGASGSNDGAGGRVVLAAGRNLTVNASSISLGPQGSNGDGAHFDMEAGTAGSGTLLVTGAINANGIGTGSGGSVRAAGNSSSVLTIGSSTGNGVSGILAADSGASGGAGGVIIVENAGSGGIKLNNNLSVSAGAAGGAGGQLHLMSSSGLIDLPAGAYSFDGVGANSDGGVISVAAGQLSVGAGGVQLSANGSGQGNGGLIDVAIAQSQDLTLQNGFMTLSATGGSAGSSAGDGGTARVFTGGNLTVQSGAINVANLGTNGRGANFALSAGGAGNGSLIVNDSLNANGKGNGAGGFIELSYASAQPFIIGGTGLTNGVTGSVTANGAGTGAGGAISIENTGNSALVVDVNSTLSAGSSGSLSFTAGSDINVDVSGSLAGKLSATGLGVDIVNQTGTLTIDRIAAGANGVRAAALNGSLDVGGSISSGSELELESFGAMNIAGALTGTSLALNTSSPVNGSIRLGAALNASAAVTISTQGSSAVTFDGGVVTSPDVSIMTDAGDILAGNNAAVVHGTNAAFTSSAGDIGNAGSPLKLSVTNLSANTFGTGAVHLESVGTGQLNLLDSSAGSEFRLDAGGSVNINDVTTGAGHIGIRTTAGKLYVTPGSNILAIDGDVTLQNDDLTSGKIGIGANTTITGSSTIAGLGDVYIGFGALPDLSEFRKPKKGFRKTTIIATDGGGVYIGKKSLATTGPENTLIAEGRNIVFTAAAKKNKKAISLEGNVTIIADPPALKTEARQGETFALAAPAFSSVSLNGFNTELETRNASLQLKVEPDATRNVMQRRNLSPSTALGFDASTDTSLFEPGFGIKLKTATALKLATVSDTAKIYPNQVNENRFIGIWSHEDLLGDGSVSRSERIVSGRDGEMQLSEGVVLFAPAVDTVISLPGARLQLKAKSLALVSSLNGTVSVYDLDDRQKHSVVIEAGAERLFLSPGHHITIAGEESGNDSFNEINPLEHIPHRSLQSAVKADGKRVFTSEFSLVAAISSIDPVRKVLQSKHPAAKQAANNLMKTAAVLMQLRGTNEFQSYEKTQLAAWQP